MAGRIETRLMAATAICHLCVFVLCGFRYIIINEYFQIRFKVKSND